MEILAHDLIKRIDRARAPSFAHGRAGTLHALLGWAIALERPLPASVTDELAGFDGRVERAPALGESWCNGDAGMVLLWARAYECLADGEYLQRARRCARRLGAHLSLATGDLCCGLAGRAYALLAMDRIDPDGGWYERAVTMARRAATSMRRSVGAWPNGLFRGLPGLVCLADDLVRPPRRRGFPLVEG
jgi:serine/threonine-protein kinase